MARTALFYLLLTVVPSLFGGKALAADKSDGLAQESIDKTQQYAANLTEQKGGWVEPGVCAGQYCVYSNRYIAGGRGISLVTTNVNRQQVDRTERWLKHANVHGAGREPPFEVKELADGRVAYVANKTIKRGAKIMGWTPVLLVHQRFFHDVKEADQDRLLDAAVKLLPWATRQKLNAEKVEKSTGHKIKDLILARPFDVNLAIQTRPDDDTDEKHYLHYPEAAALVHHCRPNLAYHIDRNLAHHTVAARKLQPGDELTIALTDPFLGRAARQGQYRTISGGACNCGHCHAGGNADEWKKSDKQLKEIKDIETHLKDHTSTYVTAKMIERLVELYKSEGLHAKLAAPYELAALNYNYLGHHKEAVKYANLANQAGIIEQGPDSVEALTMRILADDPQGHYSWKQKDKYKGPNVGKKTD